MDEGALPVLLRLSASHVASNVINACKIVDALAFTGTYRKEIISSGLKNAMEHITRYVYDLLLTVTRLLKVLQSIS